MYPRRQVLRPGCLPTVLLGKDVQRHLTIETSQLTYAVPASSCKWRCSRASVRTCLCTSVCWTRDIRGSSFSTVVLRQLSEPLTMVSAAQDAMPWSSGLRLGGARCFLCWRLAHKAHDARSAGLQHWLWWGPGVGVWRLLARLFRCFCFQAGGCEEEREAWVWYRTRCFVGAEWACMGKGRPSRGSLEFSSLLCFSCFFTLLTSCCSSMSLNASIAQTEGRRKPHVWTQLPIRTTQLHTGNADLSQIPPWKFLQLDLYHPLPPTSPIQRCPTTMLQCRYKGHPVQKP